MYYFYHCPTFHRLLLNQSFSLWLMVKLGGVFFYYNPCFDINQSFHPSTLLVGGGRGGMEYIEEVV